MMQRDDEQEETTLYNVVVNQEEQYSIWPVDREIPLGWCEAGKSGLKPECLSYIEEVWTDMRPLSLRQQMEEAARRPAPPVPPADPTPVETRTGDELVDRLSQGEHPVEAMLRSGEPVQALKESIDRGYVHIKFTATQGGSELGVRLDLDRSQVTQADFAAGTGTVHLEGGLTLNYVKVLCIADIDLQTLKGTGRLEPVEA